MILIDGQPEDKVAATDRGLAYGDGVFRTLVAHDGKPSCWRLHYAKLHSDCERMSIPVPNEEVLLGEIESVAQRMVECVVKIIVTRGAGERGYTQPVQTRPTRILISSPLPIYSETNVVEGIRARVCQLRLAEQPRLAGIKHLNRLENVLARAEWDDANIAEGLLCDQRGNVVEGVMSNIFILRQGVLLTPDLRRCGVAGVTRERILVWADQVGISTKIQDIALESIWDADELMVCNTLIGVWQVRKIGVEQLSGLGENEKAWARGTLTPLIRLYLAECQD